MLFFFFLFCFILLYNDQVGGVGRGFFVVFSFVFCLCLNCVLDGGDLFSGWKIYLLVETYPGERVPSRCSIRRIKLFFHNSSFF